MGEESSHNINNLQKIPKYSPNSSCSNQLPTPQTSKNWPVEEFISTGAFIAVFSLLLFPYEKIDGNPVPTIIFKNRPAYFHAFVLGLYFAFCGGIMTISLRQLYVGGGILASPSIFFSMLVLLMIAFLALMPLLFIHKDYPKRAAKIQSFIGTTCAAAAVPTVAAGLIPNGLLRLLVWLPFALLVLALAKVFLNNNQEVPVPEDDGMPV